MRSVEDKGWLNNDNGESESSIVDEISGWTNCVNFEFQNGNGGLLLTRTPSQHQQQQRIAMGKPTPSKWDDAQKWLVNQKHPAAAAKASPRNSNAEDRRLIAPQVPKKDSDSDSENQLEETTKNIVVNCSDTTTITRSSMWRMNKHDDDDEVVNKCVSVRSPMSMTMRDTGTEMTPIASQEPSRTATPIRATTPAATTPISSPVRVRVRETNNHNQNNYVTRTAGAAESVDRESNTTTATATVTTGSNAAAGTGNIISSNTNNNNNNNALESRALAWEEAERAKYMARYKREEMKIQAWENEQKRKAEKEMRKKEVKAERMKSGAQEKYRNKVGAARRMAEERRANAEAKLKEKEVKTSEQADYIRTTGHLPSFSCSPFSIFKFSTGNTSSGNSSCCCTW
ncbi:uncharacterized protein LOC127241552 [Andrographis paniculata]|uniref:uncharacterized protein LOC127241552 n=1 Tax=Andrographis paniculata TaxID=175694 RepID=UPI0021E78D63|nr:uncharacterized protein LOC127241552 [Andrographis paniculata]